MSKASDERLYYLSWVDKRTDPFPQHERIPNDARADIVLEGRHVEVLPRGHPEWPGVPFVKGDETAVADGRMGVYPWPGLRYEHNSRPGRVYLGPTLSALLHPASPYNDLNKLQGVFLLYTAHAPDSPHERLENLLRQLYRARGPAKLLERVHIVAVEGVTNPTDHAAIVQGIEDWIRRDDPFCFRKREGRKPTRLVINLSPGTPAMHACWLMLRWSGVLVPSPAYHVHFVQGDGGLGDGSPERSPLCDVCVDVLSHYRPPAEPPPAAPSETEEVRLEILGGPYEKLRQQLDQAALLGLPVLLHGERGTGKTFLARYYHERRRGRRSAVPAGLRPRPERDVPAGHWLPVQNEENSFVSVTLSEYATLDHLRDTLFGWKQGAWNLAREPYDGLLGAAHCGTLFLDEVHHLPASLQAALLGPLNNRLYRPMMAGYELYSAFDLVVATNDPNWQKRLSDDFRDRIERIVLEVPSFRVLQQSAVNTLMQFWDHVIRQRCRECGIEYTQEGEWELCRRELEYLFRHRPLRGNWRDLQRLADNLLLSLTVRRDGILPPLKWSREPLLAAIHATFGRD
jgi:hypothetical protein